MLARFTGLIPWTVVVVDNLTGAERRISTRNFFAAIRRQREVNGDRRLLVRWAWA